MIHDRVDHLQIARLRSRTIGKARVQKHAGAHRPEVDDRVTAYAPAVVEDGELVKKRESLRCVIVHVEDDTGAWLVSYRVGKIERPVFLTARPGGRRGDYTSEERYAMPDEPEVITESWDRFVGRVGRAIAADPPRDRRPWKQGT